MAPEALLRYHFYIQTMTSKVRLSTYSFIISILTVGILLTLLFVTFNNSMIAFWIVVGATLFLLGMALVYAPLSVTADDRSLSVRSPLKRHSLPMADIEEIQLCPPTMGAIRLVGSGGFMGYWGIFREGDVGTYTAYYGKASDCFLVRMKNGNRYLIGCENPGEMVEEVKRKMGK